MTYKDKACEYCGITFAPLSGASKYCNSCRALAHSKKHVEYCKDHKEECKGYDKKYYQKYRERHLEYRRVYHANNAEKNCARSRKWYHDHKKEALESHKVYFKEHPEKRRIYNINRRAWKKNNGNDDLPVNAKE